MSVGEILSLELGGGCYFYLLPRDKILREKIE
jgi:hypothetical protein